jgi:hypothetical protein
VKYVEIEALENSNSTEINNPRINQFDKDLQQDIDELETVKNRTKIAACMMILRTSMSKGNKNVTQALKETKHDKKITYDKIIASMLESCYSSIDDSLANEILKSEDANYWRDQFNNYLVFDKKIFLIIGPEPKLTSKEKFVQSEIQRVIAKPGIEIEVEEEKIDFLSEKFGKYKYMVIGSSIGFTISFLFMVFYIFFKK